MHVKYIDAVLYSERPFGSNGLNIKIALQSVQYNGKKLKLINSERSYIMPTYAVTCVMAADIGGDMYIKSGDIFELKAGMYVENIYSIKEDYIKLVIT